MNKHTTGADAGPQTGKSETRRGGQPLPLRERRRPLQERIARRPELLRPNDWKMLMRVDRSPGQSAILHVH